MTLEKPTVDPESGNGTSRQYETITPCYVAFVVTKDRPPQRVELGPAEPIDRALKEWRHELS